MDALLTAADVAAHFQVSVRTVTTWTRKGILPSVLIGGVRRYRAVEIEAATTRAMPAGGAAEPTRPTLISMPVSGEWNETAARPYGMTRRQWEATGLTKQDWLDQQRQGGRRRGRRTTKRPAEAR